MKARTAAMLSSLVLHQYRAYCDTTAARRRLCRQRRDPGRAAWSHHCVDPANCTRQRSKGYGSTPSSAPMALVTRSSSAPMALVTRSSSPPIALVTSSSSPPIASVPSTLGPAEVSSSLFICLLCISIHESAATACREGDRVAITFHNDLNRTGWHFSV